MLDRTRTPGTEPPTEPAQVRAQLQAALDACRRWEQDVRALEAEAAELQKQSHASHRSLVRMEKDLSTLLQARTWHLHSPSTSCSPRPSPVV